MVRYLRISFQILLFSLITSSAYSEDCSALLSNFEKPLTLKANWLFSKGDNPEWKNVDFEDTNWAKKTLPDSGRDSNPAIKETGYYWYRCRILLPENIKQISPSLSVHLGKLKDADEVYFNGNLIGQTGKFPPSLVADFEKDRIYSISSKILQPGLNILSVRIYTSTNYFGIDAVPKLGSEYELLKQNYLGEIFNISFGFVFIAMGFFFIMTSLIILNTNLSNLYFSCFSIFLGLYILIRTQFRYVLFNDFGFSYRIEIILLMALPVLFLNFIVHYVNHKRDWFIKGFEIIMLFVAITTFFFALKPSDWELAVSIQAKVLVFPLALSLYVISKNYLLHKKKLKYVFWGCVFLAPCIFIDILRALELIKFPAMSHFGFMVFLINISVQLSEEMVENYRKFQNQEKELTKMEKLKTKFLVNLSSEFKVYMDQMSQISKKLLTDPINKNTIQLIKQMENYQGLTRAVISDAVVLNAIENREYENVIEKFSLKELIEDIISMIESRLNQKRKQKTISIPYGDMQVMQSRELVFLIFYHAIENIFKYTSESTAFHIIIKADLKNTLEIEISDEGSGVDILEKSDILKKFVRGVTAREEIPGVGIGLPLIKSIVTFLGGTFELNSMKGAGTKIILTIPN
jgi:signal transduction histidine kinase